MTSESDNPLKHLTVDEQACVQRYVSLLIDQLGDNLWEVRLFGSAARGDMWSAQFPIHSDIDVLILTQAALPAEVQEELLNETYPLYLECGRQIAPQWRTLEQWAVPSEGRATVFKNNVHIEGRTLYRKTA